MGFFGRFFSPVQLSYTRSLRKDIAHHSSISLFHGSVTNGAGGVANFLSKIIRIRIRSKQDNSSDALPLASTTNDYNILIVYYIKIYF